MQRTLDTNICSYILRRHPQAMLQRFAGLSASGLWLSAIVAAELRFGAAKRGSARHSHQVHAILSAIEVLPLDMPADKTYAQLRWALEQSGRPIGPNDMLIAAQALAHECVLVTANVGEFSRITDLQVTNWLTVLDEPPPDTSATTSTG